MDLHRLSNTLVATVALVLGWLPPCFSAPPEPVVVIGVVGHTDEVRCLKNHRMERVNQRTTVGGTAITPDSVDVNRWAGKVVLIEATRAPEHRWPVVEHEAACPIAQRRSDMDDSGRIIRGKPLPLGTLRVHSARPYDGWKVTTTGDHLSLQFENKLKTTLQKVQLTAFYEGCYGKPMGLSEPLLVGTLRGGDLYKSRIPKKRMYDHAGGDRLRPHGAHTLRLTSFAANVYVLIEDIVYQNPNLGLGCTKGGWR